MTPATTNTTRTATATAPTPADVAGAMTGPAATGRTAAPPRGPTPGIDPDLKTLLRRLKLSRILDTLPERLALAHTNALPHSDFLTLILTDEVERRDRASAVHRLAGPVLAALALVAAVSQDWGSG